MKVLAIVLLCAFAAVQGRSAGVSNTNALATRGENPWIVHLRIAVGTSGYLNTCAGSLIAPSWVLTAADCVFNARFIWARYGAVEVIKPSLVLESSIVNSSDALALIRTTDVVYGSSIGPISLVNGDVSDVSKFCSFGGDENGPGEQLVCFGVEAKEVDEGKLIASSEEGVFTEYDLGAPLEGNGVQVGVLVKADGSNKGKFESIADYKDWIESTTGLKLFPEPESESESDSKSDSADSSVSSDSSDSSVSSDSDSSEEDFKVHIVN